MARRRESDGPILAGAAILVVEDEFYLAFELKAAVERAGGVVAGPFADAASAIAHLAGAQIDGAVVDVNLGNGISTLVADALIGRAVPFLLLTGYDAAALPDRFGGVDRIEKPADLGAVMRKLRALVGAGGGQAATR